MYVCRVLGGGGDGGDGRRDGGMGGGALCGRRRWRQSVGQGAGAKRAWGNKCATCGRRTQAAVSKVRR